jgi:hypothetical protein
MYSTVTIPPSSPAESGSWPTKIDFGPEAAAIHPDLVSLRRQLHQIPELGNDLPKTQAAVLQALEGLPLEITTGKALSSVVAVLRGKASLPSCNDHANWPAETGVPALRWSAAFRVGRGVRPVSHAYRYAYPTATEGGSASTRLRRRGTSTGDPPQHRRPPTRPQGALTPALSPRPALAGRPGRCRCV